MRLTNAGAGIAIMVVGVLIGLNINAGPLGPPKSDPDVVFDFLKAHPYMTLCRKYESTATWECVDLSQLEKGRTVGSWRAEHPIP